jgi:DNA-binding winged helix-turn-helix (wHTH) protein/Tfp pilus assembly protein PilF
MHDTGGADRVRFRPFALDVRSGELFKGETRLKVPDQSIEILQALIERPGQLVTREELCRRLWRDSTFVDFEHGLNAAVRRLREALGDDADSPRFIETLRRRGYRFIGRFDDTSHPPPQPRTHSDAQVRSKTQPDSPRSSTRGWLIGALMVVLTVGVLAFSTRWVLTVDGSTGPARQPSVNSDAFDAYLRGMSFRRRWQEGGCRNAVTELERAVADDPLLADAHAVLAWCYAFPARTGLPAAIVGPKATREATAALALNPALSLAHVALGAVKHRIDYDWAAAEHEFEAALKLNPADPDALFSFGEFLYASGRSTEGIARLRSGLVADPSNTDRNTGLGVALALNRQYDAAIRQLDNTLALDPQWATARRWLAYAYEARGDRDRSIAEYLRALEDVLVPSRAAETVARLKHIYQTSGWHSFWQHELELADAEKRKPTSIWQPSYARYTSPYHMAWRYARLGKRDVALSYLQQAYEQRDHMMVFIKIDPLLATLHDDPALDAIARRVGIP